jgi:hypothetical protein
MSVGLKINQFENTNQTVSDFNQIFDNSKLNGYDNDEIVEIGEIHSSDVLRHITVGDKTLIVNLVNNTQRNVHLHNPIVVLTNEQGEKILQNKKSACDFLKVCETRLNTARTYSEKLCGYFVEYKDRNEFSD